MHKTLLRLVDCILRSASSDDDLLSARCAGALLAELAAEDARYARGLAFETPERLVTIGSPGDWNALLRHLGALDGTNAETACIRQAAHTVLRLRQLQSRFAQTLENSKLEAIYTIAYGLSHELNNPLANIASRAGLLIQSSSHPDQIDMLSAISDSAMRGSEMLGDLMLTARPPSLRLVQVELTQLEQLIFERASRWTALRQLEFVMNWAAHGNCQLDQALWSEIVWALLRNAIEASGAGDTVRVEVVQRPNQLHLQVDDDGPGLSPTALQFCFDPFYSGREAGRGLGLGLTKAKRLAKLHGGDVVINNRPGCGCRAEVWVATGP